MKKTVSLLLSFVMLISAFSGTLTAKADTYTYDANKAINYAKAHWNDGVGQCAEFVANCLVAGGFPKKLSSVAGLSGFAGQITAYGKKVTSSTTGTLVPIKLSSFNGTLKKGDPICILYSKNSGSGNGHVVIYSGETTSDGIVKIYAHNRAKNNEPLYAGYSGSPAIEVFGVNLNGTTNSLDGPNNVTVKGAGNKLSVNWSAVSGANCYDIIVTFPNGTTNYYHTGGTSKDISITDLGTYKINVQSLYRPNGSTVGQIVGGHSKVVTCQVDLLGPTNVKVTTKGNNFYVTWDAVSGANCYDTIVTDPSGTSNWYHSSGTSITIPIKSKPGTYKIKVQSLYRPNGSSSGQIVGSYSAVVTYDIKLTAPQNVQVTPKDNTFSLSWDVIPGATCYDVVITKPDGNVTYFHCHSNSRTSPKMEYGHYSLWIQGIYRENESTVGQVAGAHSETISFDLVEPTAVCDHNWSDGKVINNATCMEIGVMEYTCLLCGEKKTENIEKTEHNIVIDESVPAGCTNSGWTEGSHCSVCNVVIKQQNSIPPIGHSFSDDQRECLNGCGAINKDYVEHIHEWSNGVVSKKPTCVDNGEQIYTCSKCGATETETIFAEGHVYISTVVNPTCTAKGYTENECEKCGLKYNSDYMQEKGHSWNDGEVMIAPTCNKDGVEVYTCSDCGLSRNEILPKKNHTEVIDSAVAPTCTTEGLTQGSHCSDCNAVITSQNSIPSTGHSFDNSNQYCLNGCGSINPNYNGSHMHSWNQGVVTKTANCDESGTKVYMCSTCGETRTEYIAPVGHNYTANIINATCSKNGYTTYFCSRCGNSYNSNFVPATGEHKYDSGEIELLATCLSTGIKKYTCFDCGETKTEVIPKKVHTYIITTTKATPQKNGSIVTECTSCSNISKEIIIYYPKSISLSTTLYTYDGKIKKPAVNIVDANGTTISANNYTVTYPSGRKNVGKYTVTIKFKGNYSGTVKKTFTIKPKATTVSSVTAKSKGFTVKWKKQATQTNGYQIQYSTSSKFKSPKTVTITKNSTTSKKIFNLKAKKKYYVRIRTYKTVNGTKYYSSWSKAKTVTTKK